MKADTAHYPDFVVTTYGAGPHGEEDVIRLIVEVGSLGRDLRPPSEIDQERIVMQLLRYPTVMGLRNIRWTNKAVGMCIIGTNVGILHPDGDGIFPEAAEWMSLYSDEFTQVLQSLANM